MNKPMTFNEWFLSLPKDKQEELMGDKWRLASEAFYAGKQINAPIEQNSTSGLICQNLKLLKPVLNSRDASK